MGGSGHQALKGSPKVVKCPAAGCVPGGTLSQLVLTAREIRCLQTDAATESASAPGDDSSCLLTKHIPLDIRRDPIEERRRVRCAKVRAELFDLVVARVASRHRGICGCV